MIQTALNFSWSHSLTFTQTSGNARFPDIYVHIYVKYTIYTSETDVIFVFNSEAHVSAWLHLKANLSNPQIKKIKKTFAMMHAQREESTVDGQYPYHSCRNFFSKVAHKWFAVIL